MPDLLPNSIARTSRGRVYRNGRWWLQLSCANCGAESGGLVCETDLGDNWAFHLCDPCGEKWAPLANTMLVPDEVFWARVNAEQLERYGRVLEPSEIVEALKDGNHVLSRMARDRQHVKKED